MNLLFSNDRRGEYPASWYAETAEPLPPFPPLRGEITADVVVVGAGYTGLSAALNLANAGRDVVLIDAHRVGFGASGRNGGQLGSGQRVDQVSLERLVGKDDAARLWALAEDAKTLVLDLIGHHGIDCQLRPGIAWTGQRRHEVADLHAYAEHLATHYGYDKIEVMDERTFRSLCPSPLYRGGVLDHGGAHLHPLRFALGLARAAQGAGVRIFENTHAHRVEQRSPALVATDKGRIRADHVILACNGYLGSLDRKVAARVLPINNFIVATEPLGDRAAQVLARDIAVCDSQFVVNYFRMSPDKRLLFGGGESYGYRFPRDIAAKVRAPMEKVFPQLRGVPITHAWGGTLAVTARRLPYLARLAPNVLSASGYSGHGIGNATQAGFLMARAIQSESDGFEVMSRLPVQPFPGGSAFRSPLLALAMSWYALRDRTGF